MKGFNGTKIVIALYNKEGAFLLPCTLFEEEVKMIMTKSNRL